MPKRVTHTTHAGAMRRDGRGIQDYSELRSGDSSKTIRIADKDETYEVEIYDGGIHQPRAPQRPNLSWQVGQSLGKVPDFKAPLAEEIGVALVSSSNAHCGIAEYGEMLTEAVTKASNQLVKFNTFGPETFDGIMDEEGDLPTRIVHLNHHAALHSAWTPDHVKALQAQGLKVVVTQHDTYETFKIMMDRGFKNFLCADLLIVHEQVEGIEGAPNVRYLRQGVPVIPGAALQTNVPPKPTLGLVGFPFPWKNFDLACRAAHQAGWGVRLVAPGATAEQVAQWRTLCPAVEIQVDFLPRAEVVSHLAQCRATAFLYQTGNSGTSGAIRLGIAAKVPLVAFSCRQFADLMTDEVGQRAILWVANEQELVDAFEALGDAEFFHNRRRWMARLAEQESWDKRGEDILDFYRELLGI